MKTSPVNPGKTLPKDAEAKLADMVSKGGKELDRCATDSAVETAMKRIFDPDLPSPPSAAVLAELKAPVAADLATYAKTIPGKGELIATIKTSVGTVRCQLYSDKAPMTVANFVGLATGKKHMGRSEVRQAAEGKAVLRRHDSTA